MVGFPLLLVPLAVYNIIAFLMPGVSFTDPLISLTLLSGEQWQITLSDMLLAAGVLLLLLEVIKGARPGAKYLTDHLLSLIVFGAAAAEFLLWPKFGNSTYCLLTLLALVDFISGVALRTRRRAAVAPAAPAPSVGRSQPAATEAPQPAPVVEPAPRPESPVAAPAPAAPPPAAAVPKATSVAESVLLDQSTPKPTVTSPDLQPGGQPSSDAPQR